MNTPVQNGVVDKIVMTDPLISPSARALYSIICCHADNNGQCSIGVAMLARYLTCSNRTIYRYFKELIKYGVIERTVTGYHSTTTIRHKVYYRQAV
jgi:hypothetical protein